MDVNFSQPIVKINGEPLEQEGEPYTFGMACAEALLTPTKDKVQGTEMMRRYKLAQRLYEGGTQAVSTQEAALVLKHAVDRWPPLIYGQLHEVLGDEPE